MDLPSETLCSIALYLARLHYGFSALLNFALTCKLFHKTVSHILYRSLKVDNNFLRYKSLDEISPYFSTRIASHTRKFVVDAAIDNRKLLIIPHFKRLDDLDLGLTHSGIKFSCMGPYKRSLKRILRSFEFNTLKSLSLTFKTFNVWPKELGGILCGMKLLMFFRLESYTSFFEETHTKENIASSLEELSKGISHLINLRSCTLDINIRDQSFSIAPILHGLECCHRLETLDITLRTCHDSVDPLRSFLSKGRITNLRLCELPVNLPLILSISECNSISKLVLENVEFTSDAVIKLLKFPVKHLDLTVQTVDLGDAVPTVNANLSSDSIIEEFIFHTLDVKLLELALKGLRSSANLKSLSIELSYDHEMNYLTEILHHCSLLSNLRCYFFSEMSDKSVQSFFATVKSNLSLLTLDVEFYPDFRPHVPSMVTIGPNVNSLAIGYDLSSEFSLFPLISNLRDTPTSKLNQLKISNVGCALDRVEVLRIRLDPRSKKFMEFRLVSYRSREIREQIVQLFRDLNRAEIEFEGFCVEDLTAATERHILQDLQSYFDKNVKLTLKRGKRMVCL